MRFQRLLKLAVSIFKFAVAIRVNSWSSAEGVCNQRHQNGGGRRGSAPTCRNITPFARAFATANPPRGGFPLANQNGKRQRNQRHAQRPFVPLNRPAR